MIDTLGLPLKFVFHPEDSDNYYFFDLSDISNDGYSALWNYDIHRCACEGPKNQYYWTVERIQRNIESGEWIISTVIEEFVECPEVNDLL